MENEILHFTDQNFEAEVLKSDIPVLVDFWAEWCMPCRFVAPTVEALATEYKGKIKVGKLNVDENRLTASNYGITGIPTLLVYKGGRVVDSIVGAASKPAIVDVLEKHID